MTSLPMPGVLPARRQTAATAIAGLGVSRPDPAQPGVPWVYGAACTGVVARAHGDLGVSTPSLAVHAARTALASAGMEASAIAMVLVGTTSPDVYWPSTACLVQTELGLGMVGSFDVYAAEAGGITALALGDRFVRTGTSPVLVIGAESDTALVDMPGSGHHVRQRAAAAAVLGGSGDAAILSTVIGGPDGLRPAVEECLDRAGVDAAALDLVIGEDGTDIPDAIRTWARGAGIAEQRLLLDGERYRHTGTAAPLLALVDAVEDGRLRSGMTVLLTSTGQGSASALACLRWGRR